MKYLLGNIALFWFIFLVSVYLITFILNQFIDIGSIGNFIIHYFDSPILASGLIAFGIFVSDFFESRKSDNFFVYTTISLFILAIFLCFLYISIFKDISIGE